MLIGASGRGSMAMRQMVALLAAALAMAAPAIAQDIPLPEPDAGAAIATEVSGTDGTTAQVTNFSERMLGPRHRVNPLTPIVHAVSQHDS